MLHKLTYHHLGERLKLIKFNLLVISLVLFSINIQSQNGWTQKAEIPTPRGGASACVVENKIYIIGGITGSPGYTDLAVNEVYDPLTDTWETKAPLPVGRGYLSCAVVDGIIYAIGGGYPTATKRVEAYDPVTDTWTQKADMLSVRRSAQACVVDGIIYNIGGNKGVTQTSPDCEAYDPVTDIWTPKTSMPLGGGNLAVTDYNGLIYTFGGSTYTPWSGFSHLYEFNPQTDTWTPKQNMPTARFGLLACKFDNKIYVIGGGPNGYSTLTTVEVYDPVSDTWEQGDNMPIGSVFLTGAVVNDKIYIVSGSADWSTGLKYVWEYDPLLVDVEQEFITPTKFVLSQNYPNPFNPITNINYSIPKQSNVTLKVFDVLGGEVETLVHKIQSQGNYEIEFDGSELTSGIYFYRLQVGDFVETKKMVLIK